MRIITRGDFDGLVSSVLLTEVLQIREIKLVHPKDAQDGKVKADAEDIVVNLPFIPGCGLWFDHHVSEEEKSGKSGNFQGRFEVAPSCARVIFNHYKDAQETKFARFAEMLTACDKLDSAQLSVDDVVRPTGWILLGLTLDPRTGLGPEFQKYFRWLVEYLKEVPLDKVMRHPEVSSRTARVQTEDEQFKALLNKTTKQDGNVIITDFRGQKDKPVGNRFIVFTLYPTANVEARLFNGHQGCIVIAIGHSIFNRTCNVNVGQLCQKYGGGGHRGAGTAQLAPDKAETQIREILDILKANK